MLKTRVAITVLVLTMLAGMMLPAGRFEAATVNSSGLNSPVRAEQNRFVGHWVSQITYYSGETVNDGVIDIAEASPPSADKVIVVHSLRGGPLTGHTMPYPERIEFQVSLGDDRIAHYNGVLVSANRIEGRYFVTGSKLSHHAHKRLVLGSDEWTATAQQ